MPDPAENADELAKFREEWKQELRGDKKSQSPAEPKEAGKKGKSPEQQKNERERVAMADLLNLESTSQAKPEKSVYITERQLQKRFKERISAAQTAFLPRDKAQPCLFGLLSEEMLLKIVMAVVGTGVSITDLHSLSEVCTKFYLLARDNQLWKQIFRGTTSKETQGSITKYAAPSWYKLALKTPRIAYHGIYIGCCTYIRYGERSFQDTSYQPCFKIIHYRYLRIFPDGTITLRNTPDPPESVLARPVSIQKEALKGRWRLEEDYLVAEFVKHIELPKPQQPKGKKGRSPATPYGISSQVHKIRWRLVDAPMTRLEWRSFVIDVKMADGDVYSNDMQVCNRHGVPSRSYPPFYFEPIATSITNNDLPNGPQEM
ncbi:unnamed protein product, partial [Mesorhabditis spiculigera]